MSPTRQTIKSPPARGRPPARRAPAFTLIELLTVIGIIIIVLAISLPAFNKLTQGNSQKQAVNMISAYLASARAVAISQHKVAGVVFYDETVGKSATVNRNQTAIQIFVEDPANGSPNFIPEPTHQPEYLPGGVKVATLDGNGNLVASGSTLNGVNSTSATPCRAVAFDGNGQLALISGLNAATTGSPADWNFIPASASTTPGILVYDRADYDAQNFASAGAINTWLQAHSDILIVNAYTGNLIRKPGT